MKDSTASPLVARNLSKSESVRCSKSVCSKARPESYSNEDNGAPRRKERKLNKGFSGYHIWVCRPPAFGDPQLVEILIREMLRLQCVQKSWRCRSSVKASCSESPTGEPVSGVGDADGRETDVGSSRGTLQAGLENEFRAKTLSQKDTAAHDCDPVFIEVLGHGAV